MGLIPLTVTVQWFIVSCLINLPTIFLLWIWISTFLNQVKEYIPHSELGPGEYVTPIAAANVPVKPRPPFHRPPIHQPWSCVNQKSTKNNYQPSIHSQHSTSGPYPLYKVPCKTPSDSYNPRSKPASPCIFDRCNLVPRIRGLCRGWNVLSITVTCAAAMSFASKIIYRIIRVDEEWALNDFVTAFEGVCWGMEY